MYNSDEWLFAAYLGPCYGLFLLYMHYCDYLSRKVVTHHIQSKDQEEEQPG